MLLKKKKKKGSEAHSQKSSPRYNTTTPTWSATLKPTPPPPHPWPNKTNPHAHTALSSHLEYTNTTTPIAFTIAKTHQSVQIDIKKSQFIQSDRLPTRSKENQKSKGKSLSINLSQTVGVGEMLCSIFLWFQTWYYFTASYLYLSYWQFVEFTNNNTLDPRSEINTNIQS